MVDKVEQTLSGQVDEDHIVYSTDVLEPSILITYEPSGDVLLTFSPNINTSYEDNDSQVQNVNESPTNNTSCDICGKTFINCYTLKQHSKIHTERPSCFLCSICCKSFNHKGTMIAHEKLHTGLKPFKCDECGRQFAVKSGLAKHARRHSGNKPHQCMDCNKRFLTSGDLNRHKLIHSGSKPFQCKLCDKAFTYGCNLTVHERAHYKIKPFECEHCKMTFSSNSHLKRHVRATDCVSKCFECNDCSMKFHSQESLDVHVKKIHFGMLTPFQCQWCQKCSKSSSDLDRHIKTHTGVKPFTCEICSKSFITKGNLVIHQRTHSGEKPYQCAECGKSFPQSSRLKKHSLVHSGKKPFCCQHCGKTFARKDFINIHLQTHTSREKCCQCLQCGKLFYTPEYLVKHEKRCTGVKKKFLKRIDASKAKVIKCERCGIFTKNETDLSYHKKHGCFDNLDKFNNELQLVAEVCVNENEVAVSQLQLNPEDSLILVKHESVDFYTSQNALGVSENLLNIGKNEVVKNFDVEDNDVENKKGGEQCPHCGKCFSARSILLVHLRIHTGIRPFNCVECKKCFNQKAHLDTHMARMHKIEKVKLRKTRNKNINDFEGVLEINEPILLKSKKKFKKCR